MVRAYAQAVDVLIRERGMGEDEVFTKLMAHLQKTGRTKMLPQLLRELKTLRARQSSRGPLLEVASDAEAKAAEAAVLAEGVTTTAAVNPSLVSGWRLTTADTLRDRSGKRALIDLYRSITR
ncbi:MAG TPA: hypothetical protein VGB97_00480 [Candidatus Paceibacterota bacterium]|jgi:F0F1-type ATP synthase delta subunit